MLPGGHPQAVAGFVLGAAGVSAALYALFWNGRLQRLDQQGALGLLMDLAILALILVLRWPRFEF